MRLQVREVGDGNINYVYIVEGPAGGVVVKQGLPYIRIAHDWPLTQVRLAQNQKTATYWTFARSWSSACWQGIRS